MLVSKLRTAVEDTTETWLLKWSVMSFGDIGYGCVVAVLEFNYYHVTLVSSEEAFGFVYWNVDACV